MDGKRERGGGRELVKGLGWNRERFSRDWLGAMKPS